MPKLPYGKYKGEDYRNVPSEYLEYLIEMAEKSIADCSAELERRAAAGGVDGDWAEKIISAGLRQLARQHHPDAGGDGEAMTAINGAADMLRHAVRR
jgi:hypothetical protein